MPQSIKTILLLALYLLGGVLLPSMHVHHCGHHHALPTEKAAVTKAAAVTENAEVDRALPRTRKCCSGHACQVSPQPENATEQPQPQPLPTPDEDCSICQFFHHGGGQLAAQICLKSCDQCLFAVSQLTTEPAAGSDLQLPALRGPPIVVS